MQGTGAKLLLMNGVGLALVLLLLFKGAPSSRCALGYDQLTIDQDALKEMLLKCSREELKEMVTAGRDVLLWHKRLSRTGSTILTKFLQKERRMTKYTHYPKRDVWDQKTYSQYYYHSHRLDEHGHFHLFLRSPAIPEEIKSKSVVKHKEGQDYVHLLAISMDEKGRPIELFVVNQWVTGGDWYRGEEVAKLVKSFYIDHTEPSWVVNQWLRSILILFYPQITTLLCERDRILEQLGEKDLLKDKRLEVIASVPISIEEQLEVLERIVSSP